jgi:hypothetical protein
MIKECCQRLLISTIHHSLLLVAVYHLLIGFNASLITIKTSECLSFLVDSTLVTAGANPKGRGRLRALHVNIRLGGWG